MCNGAAEAELGGDDETWSMACAMGKKALRSTACRHVAQLVLDAVLGRDGRRVATADDDRLALLRRLDGDVEERLGALGERIELEYARRSIWILVSPGWR